MLAVYTDGGISVLRDYPVPDRPAGWALIRVFYAGICRTDLEIVKGYAGFTGVPGHEFSGVVEACGDPEWIGKRVAGSINVPCGKCPMCEKGVAAHCSSRRSLGIRGLDGCMAEYVTLPVSNLVELPDFMNHQSGVLIEPFAAACRITEQVEIPSDGHAVVMGDGKLGILCAWALAAVVENVTLCGRHAWKLERAAWKGLRLSGRNESPPRDADLVVEATGTASGISEALSLCRPLGTVVLKSTVHDFSRVNLSQAVVNEIRIQGSRCGNFRLAVEVLKKYPDMPLSRLVTDIFPAGKAEEAFSRAACRDALKVLLDFSSAF
ncbi:MAG: alcohol dehydrogenase catalytic domain-containing protein [Desulfobacteraceae bacterium]